MSILLGLLIIVVILWFISLGALEPLAAFGSWAYELMSMNYLTFAMGVVVILVSILLLFLIILEATI